MGFTYSNGIKNFQPDNSPTELWINTEYSTYTVVDIINLCKEHFGDSINLNLLLIESEYIHTECLTYDCYDPADYTNFIHVTLIKE